MQLGRTVSEQDSFTLLDAFLEAGGNFLDTADMYGPNMNLYSFERCRDRAGVSEQVIGRWMKERGNRDQVIVATKVRAWMWDGADDEGLSRAHLEQAIDDSLRRLQVDCSDLYQRTGRTRRRRWRRPWRRSMPWPERARFRQIGCSNCDAALLSQALEWPARHGSARFATIQPRHSLVNRSEYEGDLQAVCARQQVAVLPFNPLAGGFLTGKYRRDHPLPASVRAGHIQQFLNDRGWAVVEKLVEIAVRYAVRPAAIALAWEFKIPQVASCITGANPPGQPRDQMAAVAISLSVDEVQALNGVSWKESEAEFTEWRATGPCGVGE